MNGPYSLNMLLSIDKDFFSSFFAQETLPWTVYVREREECAAPFC